MDDDARERYRELPNLVRARLDRLNTPHPERLAARPIPALGDRTIGEVLNDADGLTRVMTHITRLESFIGLKEPEPWNR